MTGRQGAVDVPAQVISLSMRRYMAIFASYLGTLVVATWPGLMRPDGGMAAVDLNSAPNDSTGVHDSYTQGVKVAFDTVVDIQLVSVVPSLCRLHAPGSAEPIIESVGSVCRCARDTSPANHSTSIPQAVHWLGRSSYWLQGGHGWPHGPPSTKSHWTPPDPVPQSPTPNPATGPVTAMRPTASPPTCTKTAGRQSSHGPGWVRTICIKPCSPGGRRSRPTRR